MIELHRQAGREIVRDQNPVRSLGEIDRVVVGKPEKYRQHTDVDVDQIPDSLAQQWARVGGELLAPLEENEVESLLRAEILVDELLHLPQELAVLENRQLDVEDGGLFRTGVLFSTGSHLLHSLPCLGKCLMEALDLFRNRLVGDDAVPHVGDFPAEKVDLSVHNPGRRRHAG
jgi:hypothetical protein